MTPEGLPELIRRGESLDLEFKGESRGPLSDTNLVESVVCLANRTGTAPGWLLVGVEDDGRITGARPRHEAGETDAARVRLMIANRTRPSQTVRAEVFSMEQGDILAIEVGASRQRSGRQAAATFGARWAAMEKPACVPFHFHEIHSRQADLGFLDYSTLPVPELGWNDLEQLEFSRFRRSHQRKSEPERPSAPGAQQPGPREGARRRRDGWGPGHRPSPWTAPIRSHEGTVPQPCPCTRSPSSVSRGMT